MNRLCNWIDQTLLPQALNCRVILAISSTTIVIGALHSGFEGAKTGALVASIALSGMSTLSHLALTGNFSKSTLTTIAGIFVASALFGDTICLKVKEYGLQQLSSFTPPQNTTPLIHLVLNGPNSTYDKEVFYELLSQYENYTSDLFQEHIASCHEQFSTNDSTDWLEAFYADGTEECYLIDGESLIQLKNNCSTNWSCYEENIHKTINEYLKNG